MIDNSNLSSTPTSSDLSFIIGPQLNAASRIDNSSLPTKLLISKNIEEIDSICKKSTILASNTSSISISNLGNQTKRPDKIIGMHFMNPVPIMRLVEVINTIHTSKETTQIIIDISKQMNKIPIECNDYPGFVSNRILCPMINV